MDTLNALFRWLHILAGIVWIGMLYFFNWVNGPFAATMDGDTKKKVVPELMPRALFWFRWGAAWTWITGVLLLMLVFYHGGIMFDGDAATGAPGGHRDGRCSPSWRPSSTTRCRRARSARTPRSSARSPSRWSRWWLVLMASWGGLQLPRAQHPPGRMFGTIMAFNVWYRIWPAQQKIITAVKAGTRARRGARVAGRHALAPQHLHVGAAALDDDQPAHDHGARCSSACPAATRSCCRWS